MNKLLILSAIGLLMPIVPALACFPESDEVLFSSEHRGRTFDEDYAFTRAPIPMSFCESGERSFVVVNDKCYDQDAITDYDTEKECQADPVCKAYREDQKQYDEDGSYRLDCSKVIRPMVGCGDDIVGTTPMPPSPEPVYDCSHEGLGPDVCLPIEEEQEDPNHGEIKGDEELEDEEEHQEEEEQGEEESQETTAETSE